MDKDESDPVQDDKFGLRLQDILSGMQKKIPKTNKERCRDFRENLTRDPVRLSIQQGLNRERCRIWREERKKRLESNPVELELVRQRNRLNSKRYRERQKELVEKELKPPNTRPRKSLVEGKSKQEIEGQRKEWRELKQVQRQKWTTQKKQKHRERSLSYYYKRKAERQDQKDQPSKSLRQRKPQKPVSTEPVTDVESDLSTLCKVEAGEQYEKEVKVVVPRTVNVSSDEIIDKIQSQTGTLLWYNFRPLTFEKKPHIVTITGLTVGQQKAKELLIEEIRLAEACLDGVKNNNQISLSEPVFQTFSSGFYTGASSLFNDFVQVKVKYVTSPESFSLKILHGKWKLLEQLLTDFTSKLESDGIKEALAITDPKPGDILGVHVEEIQGLFVYRAQVLNVLSDKGLVELMLVDKGKAMHIEEKKHMYKLTPDIESFPHQTIECGMANIEPLQDNQEADGRWSDSNNYMFDELVFYRKNPIFAKSVTNYPHNGDSVKPWVELWEFGGDQDVDISQEFINCGQARRPKDFDL